MGPRILFSAKKRVCVCVCVKRERERERERERVRLRKRHERGGEREFVCEYVFAVNSCDTYNLLLWRECVCIYVCIMERVHLKSCAVNIPSTDRQTQTDRQTDRHRRRHEHTGTQIDRLRQR